MSDDDISRKTVINKNYEIFTRLIQDSEKTIEQLSDQMKEKLTNDKAETVKKVIEYIQNLMDGPLIDIGTPVNKAIEDLVRMESKIDIIEKKTKTLEEQQTRMRENW